LLFIFFIFQTEKNGQEWRSIVWYLIEVDVYMQSWSVVSYIGHYLCFYEYNVECFIEFHFISTSTIIINNQQPISSLLWGYWYNIWLRWSLLSGNVIFISARKERKFAVTRGNDRNKWTWCSKLHSEVRTKLKLWNESKGSIEFCLVMCCCSVTTVSEVVVVMVLKGLLWLKIML
jgi:hypothetical protein